MRSFKNLVDSHLVLSSLELLGSLNVLSQILLLLLTLTDYLLMIERNDILQFLKLSINYTDTSGILGL